MDEFFKHAKQDLFPKMKGSAASITILHGDPDPKICLELGAAILFDKPLIILVPDRETKIPANLSRVANAVVYGSPNDPETKDRVTQALQDVLKNDVRAKPI